MIWIKKWARNTWRKFKLQGSHGSWKSWKVLEFYFGIFQDWKVLENDYKFWKVLEICKLCFDHVIFTISIACGMACKAYSKNKVIVEYRHWLDKMRASESWKNVSQSWKNPGKVPEICFWERVRTLKLKSSCDPYINGLVWSVNLLFLKTMIREISSENFHESWKTNCQLWRWMCLLNLTNLFPGPLSNYG